MAERLAMNSDGELPLESQPSMSAAPMLSMTGTFLSNQILPLKGKWEALRQRKLNVSELSLARQSDASQSKHTVRLEVDADLEMQGNNNRLSSSGDGAAWLESENHHQHQHHHSQDQQHHHQFLKLDLKNSKSLGSDFVNPAAAPPPPAGSSVATSSIAPSSIISAQDDEMLSWLQYPSDDSFDRSYCSELFGDVPNSGLQTLGGGRRSSVALATHTSPLVVGAASANLHRPATAEAAMALGAERAAGLSSQIGVEAFSRVRTSIQPPVPKFTNTTTTTTIDTAIKNANFSLATSSLVHVGSSQPRSSSSFVGESVVVAAISSSSQQQQQQQQQKLLLDPSGVVAATTTKRVVKKEQGSMTSGGGSSSCRTKSCGNDERSQQQKSAGRRYDPEPTLTSSSGGSDNTTEKSDKAERTAEKRKAPQMTESMECQSEDVEAESVDTKKPTTRPKRSRAAEVHNLSERRRRDRINEKMRALQELIPNSNKTDKASMLDEAIEYLKMLQLQLQMMSMRSGMSIPMTNGVRHQAMQHMQMPPPMAPMPYGMNMGMGMLGMNMGMGMGMGMNMVDLGSSSTPTMRPMPQADPDSYNLFSQQQMQIPVQVVNRDMYNAYMLGSHQQQHQQNQNQQHDHHHQHQHHHHSNGFNPQN